MSGADDRPAPVIFYTNGYQTWLWDDCRAPARQVQGFYTRDELALTVSRRQLAEDPAQYPVNRNIVERPYQQRAIAALCDAFKAGQRRGLLAMATGTGKTRTAVALVDVLMRANLVKRVLFLADRKELVKQAANAFKEHLPNAITVNLVKEKTRDGRVYVSTYPTMMGLIDKGQGQAGDEQSLTVFSRSLVGLEPAAARAAFSDFIANQPLDSRQIRFVEMIIEHLTTNGTIPPGRLYEPPFTGVHYEGIDGVCPADNADKVIRIVRSVNSNARGGEQAA